MTAPVSVAQGRGLAPAERYPMPTEADLPTQVVAWRVRPARAVLLVHDMQRYFLAPFRSSAPVDALVANVRAVRARCVELGVPVAYTAQRGAMTPVERGLLADFWGPGMSADPAHRGFPDGLAPAPGDPVFTKWRYSAFQRTDLLGLLRDTGRDQLIVCGVYAHIGCLMTANDAFANDVQPFLVADAVADLAARDHALALSLAARQCAATPTTATVLAHLDGSG